MAASWYSTKVLRYAPIGYLPIWEASGLTIEDQSGNNFDGTAASVTLAQPGIGDGNTAGSFDGADSVIDWYSTGLRDAFSGAEGTLLVWAKVSGAGVWTDSTQRRIVSLAVDANNFVKILKSTANGRLTFVYEANNVTETVDYDTTSPLGFFMVALTWSVTGDAMIAYFNEATVGNSTGLDTWAGTLAAALTTIGATNTTPDNEWSGSIAHVALWDSALSAENLLDLHKFLGVHVSDANTYSPVKSRRITL